MQQNHVGQNMGALWQMMAHVQSQRARDWGIECWTSFSARPQLHPDHPEHSLWSLGTLSEVSDCISSNPTSSMSTADLDTHTQTQTSVGAACGSGPDIWVHVQHQTWSFKSDSIELSGDKWLKIWDDVDDLSFSHFPKSKYVVGCHRCVLLFQLPWLPDLCLRLFTPQEPEHSKLHNMTILWSCYTNLTMLNMSSYALCEAMWSYVKLCEAMWSYVKLMFDDLCEFLNMRQRQFIVHLYELLSCHRSLPWS